MRITPLCLLAFFWGVGGQVCAEPADEARAQLATTLSALKSSQHQHKTLALEALFLERDMRHLQEATVTLARDIETRRRELDAYEEKLKLMAERKSRVQADLEAHRAQYAACIDAMIRFRSIPPEAVIAMPGGVAGMLATAEGLQVVKSAVDQEARALREALRALQEIEDRMKRDYAAIAEKKTELEAKRREMEEKIAKRARLQTALNGKAQGESAHIAALSAKSRDLRELVDTLEQSEEVADAKAENPRKLYRHQGKKRLRSFASAKGALHWPAGHPDPSASALAKGISLKVAKDSQVLAPYDGEIVYAGNFRDYGPMVIIRHTDGYHSLLSGLGRINAAPGQFVLEGEPIGATSSEARPLYLELRKNGAPVNPAPWYQAEDASK